MNLNGTKKGWDELRAEGKTGSGGCSGGIRYSGNRSGSRTHLRDVQRTLRGRGKSEMGL